MTSETPTAPLTTAAEEWLYDHFEEVSADDITSLANLLTTYAAQVRRPQWMPIATAPKDGTPIQVARHMDVFGGIWVRGWARWEELRGIGGGWISHGYFEPPGELGLAHPTHWQPLPSPPGSPSSQTDTGDNATIAVVDAAQLRGKASDG